MRLGLSWLPVVRRAAASAGCIALGSVALGGAVGCGDIEAPRTAKDPELICTDEQSALVLPGPSPVRRMTRAEYNATVRDLVGDTTQPANQFSAEEEALGFNNNASALVVTPVLAEKYMLAAEGVAERAIVDVQGLTGCDPMSPPPERDACAKTFIELFGKRAFRRPLTTEEKDEFYALYLHGLELGKSPRLPLHIDKQTPEQFETGIRMVIESALQAPEFLYRVELGPEDAAEAAGGVVPVTSWEMASRLSYFLWGSMPDDELFAAAESDALRTKEQIAAQARRMLGDPKAREAVATFHQQWLDYDRIANVTKDAQLYPEWSAAIGAMMREEIRIFIDHVVFEGEGDLATLLAAPYTFASDGLASYYGAAPPGSGDGFARVDFDKERRAGLLTMGAILAYYAHTNQTSPVHRGKLVRESFLCDIIAPPPPDVVFDLPMPDPSSTARERFAQHASGPCAGCHNLMDPIGFGFENFDTLGRYRTKENGQPVDASGEIIHADIEGKFVGVRELADQLASSEQVKGCYARMWFRWSAGRAETDEDACTLEEVETAFVASGGNVKELLVALTQTEAFLFRRAP